MPTINDQAQVSAASTVAAGSADSAPALLAGADAASPPITNSAAPLSLVSPRRPFDQPRDHKLILTQKALLDIYGVNGPDLGETQDVCHQKAIAWLRDKGVSGVSRATLRRAQRKLRAKLEPERS
jgi:hypothetical protein